MRNHVVLCGLGKVAISVLQILAKQEIPVVVITRDVPREWRARVQRWASAVVMDDERDETALVDASLSTARAIIIATDDDLANLETAMDAMRLAPNVPVVVRIYDEQLAESVRSSLPVRAVLNAGAVAAGAFVAAALGGNVLSAQVAPNAAIEIVEHQIGAEHVSRGASLAEVAEEFNGVPLAVRRKHGEHPTEAKTSTPLAVGDIVVVASARCGRQAAPDPDAKRRSKEKRLRWRPPWTVVKSLWQQTTPLLRVTLGTFAVLFVAAVVVYKLALGLTWLDAVYFTVTVVTTVGFGDIVLLHAPPLVKIFGIMTMFMGVLLLVVGLGVITNYLVTQRVEQVLGQHRTTLRDHIVIVGLGNIGYRVAMHLHTMGETVLAVDNSTDIPFPHVVRETVPVIHGDGSDPHVLHQAGVDNAKAVVAVTDNDIVNLRVAHDARAMNDRIRTVVRLFSHRLAERLGTQTLGVDVALNPSTVAGATFVACALAEGVVQGIAYRDRLLAVRRLSGDELRCCAGRPARQAARTLGAIPILVRRAGGTSVQVVRSADSVGDSDEVYVIEEYRGGHHRPPECCVETFDALSEESTM